MNDSRLNGSIPKLTHYKFVFLKAMFESSCAMQEFPKPPCGCGDIDFTFVLNAVSNIAMLE